MAALASLLSYFSSNVMANSIFESFSQEKDLADRIQPRSSRCFRAEVRSLTGQISANTCASISVSIGN